MKFQPPRGTRDFLPEDMSVRQEIFQKIRKVFEGYGYGEVCTPAFEDFELLAKKAGPEIEKEIYVFTDKSGRKLGLRFDPTVPICRIVSSSPNLPKPIKFYAIANVWRYDRPQAGRYREFWQADLELIGSSSPEADAEIIKIVSDCMDAVGIKGFSFRINSREIVVSFMRKAGIQEGKKLDVFRSLDKLGKVGEVEVEKEMERYGIGKEKIKKLLDLIKKGDQEGMEKLNAIIRLLKERGVKNVEADFSIVRGIDYYTGIVFETFVKGFEDLGSVASGGRYDTLIGLYGGEQLPATGFGIGIERIAEIVKNGSKKSAKVLVVNVNEKFLKEAVRIGGELRKKGISCETDLMGRPLRKQLEYANSRGIPWAVFIGEKEIRKKKYTLRDMKAGKEVCVSLSRLVKKLS